MTHELAVEDCAHPILVVDCGGTSVEALLAAPASGLGVPLIDLSAVGLRDNGPHTK